MDFKQLKTFVTVADAKSFTKAADALHISQPTVSAHILALEEELNVQLFLRTTKHLEITKQGRDLYECAIRMEEMTDRLCKQWESSYNFTISLGVSTIPSAYILPKLLPEFKRIHPDVQFSVHQDDSFNIAEGLLSNQYDLGIIGMRQERQQLISEPFYSDHMVLITENSNEYSCKSLQKILETSPMILREKGSGSGKSADRILTNLGLSPEKLTVAARMNDTEAIKNLVSAGFGVAIVSEMAARNYVEEERLLAFPLPDDISRRELYLTMRKDISANTVTREFIEFIRRKFENTFQ